MDAALKYGSVLLENKETADRDYDFAGQNSIDDVGEDNVEEFHEKLKNLW
jgi:hypothetical protein